MMKKPGMIAIAAVMLGMTMPASAQLYYEQPDLATPPVTGAEPSLGLNLPGATPTELKAALVWHLRVAMNVAALQCDFEPSLLTVSNYNATLAHHKKELSDSFDMLTAYFRRTGANSAKAATNAFDMYNTRAYSSYSTVHAQKDFCNVMSQVGRDAIFADRGTLAQVAQKHLGEIKRALVPSGDQYFTNPAYNYRAVLPDFDKKCWKKENLQPDCEKAWRDAVDGRSQAQ